MKAKGARVFVPSCILACGKEPSWRNGARLPASACESNAPVRRTVDTIFDKTFRVVITVSEAILGDIRQDVFSYLVEALIRLLTDRKLLPKNARQETSAPIVSDLLRDDCIFIRIVRAYGAGVLAGLAKPLHALLAALAHAQKPIEFTRVARSPTQRPVVPGAVVAELFP